MEPSLRHVRSRIPQPTRDAGGLQTRHATMRSWERERFLFTLVRGECIAVCSLPPSSPSPFYPPRPYVLSSFRPPRPESPSHTLKEAGKDVRASSCKPVCAKAPLTFLGRRDRNKENECLLAWLYAMRCAGTTTGAKKGVAREPTNNYPQRSGLKEVWRVRPEMAIVEGAARARRPSSAETETAALEASWIVVVVVVVAVVVVVVALPRF
ncbi:hypothetical protein BJ875DRAFT_436754 [Amylocarpus encephaloides]|uniref:Uncharacterized protein n=1 Tax=Amylocarpus encephaloides TaxID=45428 RepID=A0A9P7YSH6_9HELO|nr:hypothetical protein BJ875DRAFT_436754 [Amylocarpus encephaloides]